jgi:hypothetical protein
MRKWIEGEGASLDDPHRPDWPVGHVDLDLLPLQELSDLYDLLTDEERLELRRASSSPPLGAGGRCRPCSDSGCSRTSPSRI